MGGRRTIDSMARQTSPLASTRGGMGAIPFEGGVTFRVWAPHADAVSVIGSFNDWDPGRDLLSAEDGGTWSTDVAGAADGDEYRFTIRADGRLLYRIDPRGG
jgi:1,4-alpha-glucan branching enzyme